VVLGQQRWDRMKRAHPQLTFLIDRILSAVEHTADDLRGALAAAPG